MVRSYKEEERPRVNVPVKVSAPWGEWKSVDIDCPSIVVIDVASHECPEIQNVETPFVLYGHHGKRWDELGGEAVQMQNGTLYLPKPGEWWLKIESLGTPTTAGATLRVFDADDPAAGRYNERKLLLPVNEDIIAVDDAGVLVMAANARRRYLFFQNVTLDGEDAPDPNSVISVHPYTQGAAYEGWTLHGFGSNMERDEAASDKMPFGAIYAICPAGASGLLYITEAE